jgi:hypothetical protein
VGGASDGVDWIAYYADGSTFSSADGEPEDVPPNGVIAIWQRIEGRPLATGAFYSYRHGEWIGHDLPGAIAQMKERGMLKEGLYLSRAEWKAHSRRWPAD